MRSRMRITLTRRLALSLLEQVATFITANCQLRPPTRTAIRLQSSLSRPPRRTSSLPPLSAPLATPALSQPSRSRTQEQVPKAALSRIYPAKSEVRRRTRRRRKKKSTSLLTTSSVTQNRKTTTICPTRRLSTIT